MAINSIREQILVYHEKYLVGKIGSIKTVVRVMPSYNELQQFAITQFPLIAMVGRVPVPEEKISTRDGSTVDIIVSSLKIDNFVYVQQKENPDSVMSEIMDDVWVKCYSNVTYGGLVLSTTLVPEEELAYWEPFVAFKITTQVRYTHTTGGI